MKYFCILEYLTKFICTKMCTHNEWTQLTLIMPPWGTLRSKSTSKGWIIIFLIDLSTAAGPTKLNNHVEFGDQHAQCRQHGKLSCLTCILRKHTQECVCRVGRCWSRSSYVWQSIWDLRPHGRWSWSEDNQGSMSTAMEHDIWRDRRIGVQKN